MHTLFKAACAAAIVAPMMIADAQAAVGPLSRGLAGPQASPAPAPPPPPPSGGGGGGGGFTGGGGGGGFHGGSGFRGRGGYYGGGFYGGFGPGFGYYDPWYDPFWGPRFGFGYGYGLYGYYPPTRVIVRERVPPPDYLLPPDGPAPEANWYYCPNPDGYYPYVKSCTEQWQAVPVRPDRAPPQS